MAFQTGTKVRPELGQLDYSGFDRANAITAQALSNLGKDIESSVQTYQKNKMITSNNLATIEGIAAQNPEILVGIKSDPEMSKVFSQIEKGNTNVKNTSALLSYANAVNNEAQNQQSIRLADIEEQLARRKLDPVKLTTDTVGSFDVLRDQTGKVYQSAKVSSGGASPSAKDIAAELYGSYGENVPSGVLEQVSGQTKTELKKLNKQFAEKPKSDVIYPHTEVMLEDTAKTAMEWQSGGNAQAANRLNNLSYVLDGLETGNIETGTLADKMTSLVPDFLNLQDVAKSVLKPTGQDAYDNVVKIVATGLRESLGAQFTQKEGQMIINASYNSNLPTENNIRRLRGMVSVMEAVNQAKEAQSAIVLSNLSPSETISKLKEIPSALEVYNQRMAEYSDVLKEIDADQDVLPEEQRGVSGTLGSGSRFKIVNRNKNRNK